ncbi:MAG: ABC transporter substrate-binding protein [Provencibacterium sp.]|nr:ABC transporter substrate-binding protein [Provencibacterium sp.]
MKHASRVLLSALLLAGLLASCGRGGGDSSSSSSAGSPASSGGTKGASVYYLNFKPEIASVYEEIAKEYEAETGVRLQVVTAASGTYEQTLKSEIAKADAPTIFQINGPVGYEAWKDYCLDLSGSELYSHLTDKSLAVTSGDGVYGIPYVVEGYGIIYNNEIMDRYFALPDKAVSIESAKEIHGFPMLREVVEDMTAKKEALGIDGVFASTSMSAGNQWRWQTHLANLPLYYEFRESAGEGDVILEGLSAQEIAFTYAENFQNLFDLYLQNSTTAPGLLGGKSVADSMAEFALGRCAMVQNGNWAWSEISGVEGNTVGEEDIKFMPLYTGMEGEEAQGLCIGTENYLAVNAKASPEQQKAALDFLTWLFTSSKGKSYVSGPLGFIAPFDTFSDEEKPADPLAREVLDWMERDVQSVVWTFAAFPSEDFKNDFGDALLEYAQGSKTFDEVKEIVVRSWKSEREKTGAAA